MLPEEVEKINQLIQLIQERERQVDRVFKEQETQVDKIWSAVYQLQNEMNALQIPTMHKIQPIGRTRQSTLDDFGKSHATVWSELQWEQWASDIYTNYPTVAQYLPDWFLAKMQKR